MSNADTANATRTAWLGSRKISHRAERHATRRGEGAPAGRWRPSYDWGFRNMRTPDSYRRELDATSARMRERGVRCKSFPSPDLSWTEPARGFDCGFFWGRNLRIAFSGDITLGGCSPFKERYSYGNVRRQPFSEIFINERFQKNRMLARQRRAQSHLRVLRCVPQELFRAADRRPISAPPAGWLKEGLRREIPHWLRKIPHLLGP